MDLFPLILVLLGLLSQALAATYYTLLFTLASAGSQYGITSFDSTMIVPPTSSNSGSHSAWPGLEPESEGFVYQNVLIDFGAQWYFFTEYCCDPSNYDYPPQAVSPGNSMISSFNLDTTSGKWTNTWSQVTGSAGAVSSDSFPTEDILSQAVFAIELQDGATWDFGDVTWSDITIVANTTSTSWCTSYEIFGAFTTTISTPVATVSGSSSTCYIASLVFHAP